MRSALASLVAASIEWYDFFVFATAAALVFPHVFFSADLPPQIALIASYSTFAVGFIARPAGAILFGHFGDRRGRKAALSVSLILMGVATSAIGLLPSYQSIGPVAALLLVSLRFIQGVALGGQWGGAMLLATENAPKARRGLYGSLVQAGVPVGVLSANVTFLLVSALATSDQFAAIGWRVPFLLSALLVYLGIYLQSRVEDSPDFRLQGEPDCNSCLTPTPHVLIQLSASPIIQVLRRQTSAVLWAAGASVATNLCFYILITYIISYGSSAAGLNLSRSTMLIAVLVGNLISLPALMLAGSLSDRFGRRPVFITGVAMAGLWSFALFPLLDTRSSFWITFAIVIGLSANCISYGPMAAMFAEIFDSSVRYSGVSLAYQIGAIIGGGFAPIIATGLFATYHSNLSVSIYMAAACAISILCASRLDKVPRAKPH